MGEGGEVNVSLPNTQVLLVYELNFHNFLMEVYTNYGTTFHVQYKAKKVVENRVQQCCVYNIVSDC